MLKTAVTLAIHARAGALVYRLCEARELPVLVTDCLASLLDQRDLFTIGTLSKQLHEQASDILYEQVVLDLSEGACAGRRLPLLLRTLLTSSFAAKYLHRLSLTGTPLLAWKRESTNNAELERFLRRRAPVEICVGLSTFSSREASLLSEIGFLPSQTENSPRSSISLGRCCLMILGLPAGLQDVTIESDLLRYPEFGQGLRHLVEVGRLQQLQRSTLCLDLLHGDVCHTDAVLDWNNTILTPLLLPNMSSFAAVLAHDLRHVEQLSASSITRLTLHHVHHEPSDLNRLLGSTSRLRYLEYHALVNYQWYV